MAKKRLRKNKKQGMNKRHGKKPMSAVQKEALKKLRESTKAASEAFKAKQKAGKN